jgi:hypothetical protein
VFPLLSRWAKFSNLYLSLAGKEAVAEPLGPSKKTRRNTLGSFIRHGLTQPEVEAEAFLQMYLPYPTLY